MLNCYISSNGPNGFSVGMRHPATGKFGNLPGSSELYELLKQATALLLSNASTGTLCGSEKNFVVKVAATGVRTLTIPLAGFSLYMVQNVDARKRYDATLTFFPDFIFPEETGGSSFDD